jgi:acetate kinase
VTIHLGNGSSMAAVDKGRSVDTTMGLGPMGGLIMGTRSGDIDPSIIFHLIKEGYTAEEVNKLLNKQSGMLGLTGYSDMRDVLKAISEGDKKAKLAYDMYAYRIKKYIGSYAAVLNGLDAIVFTAGIGENDNLIREKACTNMEFLGLELDTRKNNERSKGLREINKEGSAVKILVIPTNEELEIVRQCFELLAEVNV